MARNRITGRETQKMQEYTQGQISQAERRGIEFPTDVKEQLFEYANLIGEEEKVRTLVRNLVYLSSNSISSSTLETRCFCSKVYNVLRRSDRKSTRLNSSH